MTPTLEQVLGWFDEFNEVVFDNGLSRVPIKFTNNRRQLGQFHWGGARGTGIKISLYWDRTEEEYRNTLLHEMCHLYCHLNGWIYEGHGPRWKRIARVAYEKTGLVIKRTTDTSKLEVADRNKAKHEAFLKKKNAPCIILDCKRRDYHFIVKTSKTVLMSLAEMLDKDKDVTAYVVDDPLSQKMSTTRSITRGYKFANADYEQKVLPILEKSTRVDSLKAFFKKD